MKFRWAAPGVGVLEAWADWWATRLCNCKCNAWVCTCAVMSWGRCDCLVCGVCHRWERCGEGCDRRERSREVACVVLRSVRVDDGPYGWKRMGHLGAGRRAVAATTWVLVCACTALSRTFPDNGCCAGAFKIESADSGATRLQGHATTCSSRVITPTRRAS